MATLALSAFQRQPGKRASFGVMKQLHYPPSYYMCRATPADCEYEFTYLLNTGIKIVLQLEKITKMFSIGLESKCSSTLHLLKLNIFFWVLKFFSATRRLCKIVIYSRVCLITLLTCHAQQNCQYFSSTMYIGRVCELRFVFEHIYSALFQNMLNETEYIRRAYEQSYSTYPYICVFHGVLEMKRWLYSEKKQNKLQIRIFRQIHR